MHQTAATFAREAAPSGCQARRWSDIERSQQYARDLRSKRCAGYLARAFRRLRRSPAQISALPAALARTGAFGLALLLAPIAMTDRVSAQEANEARLAQPGGDLDHERLAALGIASATIDEERNVEALWRAVRELVLPGRLTVPMQQRILRRVWLADPDIRDRPVEDSATN